MNNGISSESGILHHRHPEALGEIELYQSADNQFNPAA